MFSPILRAWKHTRMEFTDYVALFFFGLMILGGAALTASGIRDLRMALASPHWPSVPGVIRESETWVDTSGEGSSNHGSPTYHVKVSARYKVNGAEYETETLYFGFAPGSGDASTAELEHLRYPKGAEVLVFHHPGDPARAVLRPGFDLDVLGPPMAGLVIALMGLSFALVFLGAFKDLPVMPLGLCAFGLVFLGGGISMLTAGLLRLKNAHDSLRWPVASARIVYSGEHSSTSEVKDRSGEISTVTSFGAALAYRYEVDGRTYYSNVRRFGALVGASKEWAQAILWRYPSGEEVPVSYDPNDPNRAVLEPGITPEAFWLPGAGAASLLFSLAVLVLASRYS